MKKWHETTRWGKVWTVLLAALVLGLSPASAGPEEDDPELEFSRSIQAVARKLVDRVSRKLKDQAHHPAGAAAGGKWPLRVDLIEMPPDWPPKVIEDLRVIFVAEIGLSTDLIPVVDEDLGRRIAEEFKRQESSPFIRGTFDLGRQEKPEVLVGIRVRSSGAERIRVRADAVLLERGLNVGSVMETIPTLAHLRELARQRAEAERLEQERTRAIWIWVIIGAGSILVLGVLVGAYVTRQKSIRERAHAIMRKAAVALEAGDYSPALEQVEEALRLAPHLEEALKLRNRIIIDLAGQRIRHAEQCLARNELDEAEELADQALELAPEHEGALQVLVQVKAGRTTSSQKKGLVAAVEQAKAALAAGQLDEALRTVQPTTGSRHDIPGAEELQAIIEKRIAEHVASLRAAVQSLARGEITAARSELAKAKALKPDDSRTAGIIDRLEQQAGLDGFKLEVQGARPLHVYKRGDLTIGRAQGSRVLLDDMRTSRENARVRFDGDRPVVESLGSAGTFINDRQVQAELLSDGELLRFGAQTTYRVAAGPGFVQLEPDGAGAAVALTNIGASISATRSGGMRLGEAGPAALVVREGILCVAALSDDVYFGSEAVQPGTAVVPLPDDLLVISGVRARVEAL